MGEWHKFLVTICNIVNPIHKMA